MTSGFHPAVWGNFCLPRCAHGMVVRSRTVPQGPWQHAPSGHSCAGSTAGWWDTPGSHHPWTAGQVEKEPAQLIWLQHLTYFVLCPPCYKPRSSVHKMPWIKYKNTSLRKRRWPGNADDAKLRLCFPKFIYKLWMDFFMLWVSFYYRK